jgi:hypothetical protein
MWQIPAYFIIYLGAVFVPTYKVGQFLPYLLTVTGITGLAMLLFGWYLISKTRLGSVSKTLLPYSFMFYGVLCAAITALGRTDYGLELALLSRYHIFQLFYLFGLIWLLIVYLLENSVLKKYSHYLQALFVVMMLFNWLSGIALGVIKVHIISPVEKELREKGEKISNNAAYLIYTDPDILRSRIKMAKEMRYNVFRDVK